MNEFLRFFNETVHRLPMHMEIRYNKHEDWVIEIWRAGMAEDYPTAKHIGGDVTICYAQDNDIELCFAKAHVDLKEWLIEYEGGY